MPSGLLWPRVFFYCTALSAMITCYSLYRNYAVCLTNRQDFCCLKYLNISHIVYEYNAV